MTKTYRENEGERAAFLDVAHWCDEEYRRLCMLPVKSHESEAALQLVGRRAELACMAEGLRSWAATGKPPPHQKVRDECRIPYERQAAEDAEMMVEERSG